MLSNIYFKRNKSINKYELIFKDVLFDIEISTKILQKCGKNCIVIKNDKS